MSADTVPIADKALLRIPEAGQLLSLSRTEVYRLINAGRLQGVHVGGRMRVTRAALDRYVSGLEGEAEARELSTRALLARPRGNGHVRTRSA